MPEGKWWDDRKGREDRKHEHDKQIIRKRPPVPEFPPERPPGDHDGDDKGGGNLPTEDGGSEITRD